jgi:thiamine biosynthesis lipoprotein ApbE
MAKLSKNKGIELIIEELKKGTAKVAIMATFGKNWQTPKDTFNKWYLIALNEYTKDREAIEKEKAEVYKQTELNRQKGVIIEREKALEMVSNVVKITFNQIAKQKDNPNEKIIGAFNMTMDRLSKMQGFDDAPKKEPETNENDTIVIE